MTMISRRSMTILAAAALVSAMAAPAWAQAPQEKPAPPPKLPTRVEVVISRYQGDKKVSSQPYVLMPTVSQTPAGRISLRIGVDVPVGTTTTTLPPEGGRQGVTTTQPKYTSVGTNIDCWVAGGSDGKFDVYINLTDSSIFNPDGDNRSTSVRVTDGVAIRNFTASNTLTMKHGDTMLLATASDKVTGEVIKVEVTFVLLK
jgi:hypothetical protein